jgi:hypothetical protein
MATIAKISIPASKIVRNPCALAALLKRGEKMKHKCMPRGGQRNDLRDSLDEIEADQYAERDEDRDAKAEYEHYVESGMCDEDEETLKFVHMRNQRGTITSWACQLNIEV